MGARGPVGLPPNVHRMRGTVAHADRGGAPTAPIKLRPSTPEPPDWLDAEAAAEWSRVVPELDAQGLLATVDRAILTNYCTAWAVVVRTAAELAAVESVTTEGAKKSVKCAQFVAWRDAATLLSTLAGKVFCTPTDRLRMRLPSPPNHDPLGILD